MKIALDATCFNERPSGAKQRFVGLYGSVVRAMPEVEFVVYTPADVPGSRWLGTLPNISYRGTPIPSNGRLRKASRSFSYWSGELRRMQADVVERFNFPIRRSRYSPTVLTIHDLRKLRRDVWAPRRSLNRLVLCHGLFSADRVVTVSATMRKELLAVWPSLYVAAIHNGVDPKFGVPATEVEKARVVKKFDLPREFMLSVGHLEPRKNYRRLIEAVALLHERGSSCALVIIGNDSGEGRALAQLIASRRLTSTIRLLHGVSDDDVRCIYQLGSGLLFPSTYEGFGIPILEGMSVSLPMALSNIEVFREIAGDGYIYFDPYDVESIAASITQMHASNRALIRRYAETRVKKFYFDSLSQELVALYAGMAR